MSQAPVVMTVNLDDLTDPPGSPIFPPRGDGREDGSNAARPLPSGARNRRSVDDLGRPARTREISDAQAK